MAEAKVRHRKRRIRHPHLEVEPLQFHCPTCRQPAMNCESPSAAAPPTQPNDVDSPAHSSPPSTAVTTYDHELLAAMHACTRKIDNRMFHQQRKWLCDQSIYLALLHLNRLQGPAGDVLFINSLVLQGSELDIHALTTVDGRVVNACTVLVKAPHIGNNHWATAVWDRRAPTTVYLLDSQHAPTALHKSSGGHASSRDITRYKLQHFLSLCTQLTDREPQVEFVQVAQQSDGWSCGLFCIEFCRVLAQTGASMSAEATLAQLREVDVKETRAWLSWLNKTMGLHAVPPPDEGAKKKRKREDGDKAEDVPADSDEDGE